MWLFGGKITRQSISRPPCGCLAGRSQGSQYLGHHVAVLLESQFSQYLARLPYGCCLEYPNSSMFR